MMIVTADEAPRDDLRSPPRDGAAEASDLERHLGVGEVAADLGDPLRRELGVGVVVDLADDFLRVPRGPHLLVRVTGTQQPHQSFVLIVGETLSGDREPAACSPQWVVSAAAVAEGFVLHAAPALIESGVGEVGSDLGAV